MPECATLIGTVDIGKVLFGGADNGKFYLPNPAVFAVAEFVIEPFVNFFLSKFYRGFLFLA